MKSPQKWFMLAAVIALFWVTVFGPGCCSSELQKQAQLSEGRVAAFVALMDDAQTERQDEQEFIRACGDMFSAMREATGAEPLGGSSE